jgi:1,2-diacylglycerol 3-alpha-glucosyltransferase
VTATPSISVMSFVGSLAGTLRGMRIAMLLDAWDDAPTGAVISTQRFAERLRDRGHTVTIVSTGAPTEHKIALPELRVPFAQPIITKMRTPLAWPDRRLLARAVAGADLVHVHSPFLLAMRGISMAKRAGVPTVATFHVRAEHVLRNIGVRSQAVVELLNRFFLRSVYSRCDHVICPSEFGERELRRHGLRTPTTVVSNGIPAAYRPLPRTTNDRFVILSVGRLAPEKRLDVLIEAVRRSRHEPDIQLVILGDGPLGDRLRDQARCLTNPAVFDCLPTQELISHYNAADLYVHTAEIEVECMSVLEAMGCGLPCLIAESATDETARLARSERFRFPAGSPQALAARIDYWIDHPDELKAARTGYAEDAWRYPIDTSVDHLLTVYQRLIARQGVLGH